MNEEERKKLKFQLLLLQASLQQKWHKNSTYEIDDFCPFCWQYLSNRNKCSCPSSICQVCNDGNGYIRNLMNNYGSKTMIKDLSSHDLNHMRKLFLKEIQKIEIKLAIESFHNLMKRRDKHE